MAEELPVEAMSEAKPKSSKSDSIMEGLYFGTVEQTFEQSAYFPDSQRKPYNPDPIVQQDYTYSIYEEMRHDDQVNAAMQVKKDLVVGSGWHIVHEDDDIKKELEESLSDDVERPISEILQDIVQAYDFGFSISEKIFKNLSDGRLALKNIKTRHPSTWLIHTDPQGNITRYEQRGPMSASIDVDPNCLIHYTNNERYQNPYGESDLRAAYQAYMTKRHITRYYAIFLENAAGPKPVAKYDRKAPQTVVDAIFASIKKFQTKTAMVIPKDFEIEFLEAKNTGEPYAKGIHMFNMFIGRALFIPDLLGFSGSETGGGSFSLGKEQIGLFYKHIYRRREILERIIDQHVIRPLCIYNYGQLETYPKFKFNPLSDDDAKLQAEMWIKGVQGVGWQPTSEEINHFRQLVKFPESDELVMKAEIAAQQMGQSGTEEDKLEDGENKDEQGKKAQDSGNEDSPDETKKESEDKKEFGLKAGLSSLPGVYHKKVDFKVADQILKTAVSKIKQEAAPIIDEIFQDLYDQLQKKRIVQSQNIEKAETIRLKYLNKLQIILKKQFRNLYKDAQDMARNEVKKSDFNTNIPADEFLEFLEMETFKYVGDLAYEITKETKQLLINAIKDGTPLSNVLSVLDNKGGNLTDASLERFARTKTTEVFNRGRMEYFNSTGVVAAYQYSAILDDVTSEICGELNGLTFEKNQAPVPPLHFNCRSVLIPITRFEEWSVDGVTNSGKPIDKFLQTNVADKGFAIYSSQQAHKEKLVKYKITDDGVTFEVEMIDPVTEKTTYSMGNKPFQESLVEYFEEDKKKIKKVSHIRLDDEPSI